MISFGVKTEKKIKEKVGDRFQGYLSSRILYYYWFMDSDTQKSKLDKVEMTSYAWSKITLNLSTIWELGTDQTKCL